MNDSWTELILELHCLFYKFLVAFGQNIIWVLLKFLIEDINFIRLLFSEGNIADILEHSYLFAFRQEDVLKVDEELLQNHIDRLVPQIFIIDEIAFSSVGGNSVVASEDQRAVLEDELLEASIV